MFSLVPQSFVSGAAAVQTFVGITGTTTNASSHTFSSHSLGSTSNGDYVLVAACGDGANTGTTLSSATIDGTSATILAQFNNNFTTVAFFIANEASATGDIVCNWSASKNRAGVCVWRVDNLTAPTSIHDSSTVASVGAMSLDVQAGGIIFGNSTGSSGGRISGASLAYASASTGVSVTSSGNGDVGWTTLTEDGDTATEAGSGDGASLTISIR